MRLAVDLGLHLDPEPYVQAGIIDAEEAMIRKVVWGGVFVHDRYSPPGRIIQTEMADFIAECGVCMWVDPLASMTNT